jgi:hypothetical protein
MICTSQRHLHPISPNFAVYDQIQRRKEQGDILFIESCSKMATETKKLMAPKILDNEHCWGELELEGYGTLTHDVKLFPGGFKEWKWGDTLMRHQSGIRIADVQDLLDEGCTTIILAMGYESRVQVHDETLPFLESKEIQVYVLENKLAIKMYNNVLEQGRADVGMMFHLKC